MVTQTLQLIWPVAVTVATVLISICLFKSLTFTLELAITSRRITDDPKLVILGLKIKNISKVSALKGEALLKVDGQRLPETDSVKSGKCFGDESVDFDGADRIITSTRRINPRERVYVERIYVLLPGDILHVGLQFKEKWGFLSWGKRQTTTCYIESLAKTEV